MVRQKKSQARPGRRVRIPWDCCTRRRKHRRRRLQANFRREEV